MCPKLIVIMFILLATPATSTSFPFFFSEVIILGRKWSSCSSLTFHIIHLVKSLLPSLLLLTQLHTLLHAGQGSNRPYSVSFPSCALILYPMTLSGSNVPQCCPFSSKRTSCRKLASCLNGGIDFWPFCFTHCKD